MDLTTFGMAGVAAITVICYLAATAVKQTPPDFPAGDPLTALAVGIVSGLAATGTNQLIRQLKQPE